MNGGVVGATGESSFQVIEYTALADRPELTPAKGYFTHGRYLIEMAPQGPPHSTDWDVISFVVGIYCAKCAIPARSFLNATREIRGTLDLRTAPVPDIVIPKRLLYEEMGVAEYWVEDVERMAMLGWAISGETSTAIRASHAIPGLTFDLIEEALRLQRETDLSQTIAMLLERLGGMGG